MPIDLIITVGGLCAAVGAGFGLGVLLGRHVWPRVPPVDPATMAAAKVDIARLAEEITTLKTRAGDLDIRCRAAADEARKAGEDGARLAERIANLTAIVEPTPELRHDTALPDRSRKLIEAAAEPLRARVQPSRKKVETRRSQQKTARVSRSKNGRK